MAFEIRRVDAGGLSGSEIMQAVWKLTGKDQFYLELSAKYGYMLGQWRGLNILVSSRLGEAFGFMPHGTYEFVYVVEFDHGADEADDWGGRYTGQGPMDPMVALFAERLEKILLDADFEMASWPQDMLVCPLCLHVMEHDGDNQLICPTHGHVDNYVLKVNPAVATVAVG